MVLYITPMNLKKFGIPDKVIYENDNGVESHKPMILKRYCIIFDN